MMCVVTRMVVTLGCALALAGCGLFESDKTEGTKQRGQVDFKPGRPSYAPLPNGVPFVGEEGADDYGRPRKRPDSPALLALLHAKRFDELDAAMEHYQSQFEADPAKELWPMLAIGSFDIADTTLGPTLDAWVDASPMSFGAHASRASWTAAMGWAARGGAFDPSDEQLKHFREWVGKALSQSGEAIRLRPMNLASITSSLHNLRAIGDRYEVLRRTYEQALSVCSSCSAPRAAWVFVHAPRWGGSEAAMVEATKVPETDAKKNPALALLPSLVKFDRCRTTWEQDGKEAAEEICRDAATRGPVPRVACRYGDLLVRLEKYDQAEPVIEAALRVDPQRRRCLRSRAWIHKHNKRFEAAAQDLLLARRLDPMNSDIEKIGGFILKRLRYDARVAGDAGDNATDRRLRALANAISPGAGDPRANIGLSAKGLATLQVEVDQSPRDFALHIKLDQALARVRRFSEIVTMWDRFLIQQPDHTQALLERAGAKWHSGDQPGAVKDAERACDLGLKKACSVSLRMQRG